TVDPFVLTGTIAPIVVDGETFFPDPDDAIQNVTIADNEIVDVGGSGIASLALEVEHGGDAMAPPLCLRRRTFVVQGMTIRDNRIADGALSRVTEGARAVLGGVVLSDVL